MNTPIEISSTHQYHGIVCPVSKDSLYINKNELWLYCLSSNLAYPIRNKIPVMLPSEARALTDDERAVLKAQTP